MILTYYETKRKDIEIPEIEVLKVTKAKLLELVSPGEFLTTKWDAKKGVSKELWLAMNDPNWRHGSFSTEYLHEATEFEKAVFLVIDKLNEINNKNGKNIRT